MIYSNEKPVPTYKELTDKITKLKQAIEYLEGENKVLQNLYEELTEQIVGDNSEGRYNHEEIIQRVNDLLDIEQRFNNVLTYS